MLLLKQLALAATAAAFLVVPETTETDEEAFKALPVDAYSATADIPVTAMQQTLDLPCAKCKGKNTHLSMDFAVEDGSRLVLNGYELYPSADPWHGDLTAEVVKASGKSKEQMLGYSLAVGPQAYDETQALEIVNVGLHVIEVGGRFIEGIPTVNVKLIKAQTGEILIGAVNMVDAQQAECSGMWCRVKEGLDEAWKGIKAAGGCRKHKGHGHHGGMKADGGRPHGSTAHHAHERVHHWGKLIKDLAYSILLPVLTGITAGVGVAVFIMGLCSVVALLVRSRRRRCRRANRRARRHSKAVFTDAAAEEEKTGLMEANEDETEAPPQYEARD